MSELPAPGSTREPHVRTKIRRAIQALLMDQTAVGDRIFLSKIWPIGEDDAVVVYTLAEEMEPSESTLRTANSRQRRHMTLAVDVQCFGTTEPEQAGLESLDDTLDHIASEIEVLVAEALDDSSSTLGSLTRSGYLVATEFDFGAPEGGGLPTGIMHMTWRITYSALMGDPTTNV